MLLTLLQNEKLLFSIIFYFFYYLSEKLAVPTRGGIKGFLPLLSLCQLFWGISQRRRARSPKDTHLFRGGMGF